jgi:hypothetical protein
MATAPANDSAEGSGSDLLRDAAKFVVEHPIALYDPPWLKHLHPRCLWDGGSLMPRSDFCSRSCEERYVEWEHGTVHVLLGREPLQTFYEQGRELGG